jgi:hypothetical protein
MSAATQPEIIDRRVPTTRKRLVMMHLEKLPRGAAPALGTHKSASPAVSREHLAQHLSRHITRLGQASDIPSADLQYVNIELYPRARYNLRASTSPKCTSSVAPSARSALTNRSTSESSASFSMPTTSNTLAMMHPQDSITLYITAISEPRSAPQWRKSSAAHGSRSILAKRATHANLRAANTNNTHQADSRRVASEKLSITIVIKTLL